MDALKPVHEVEEFIQEFEAVLEDISIDGNVIQLRLSHGYHYADLSKTQPVMVLRFVNHNHLRSGITGWFGAYLSEIIVTGAAPYNVELCWNEMQSDIFSCSDIYVERENYSAQDVQNKYQRLSREYDERIEAERNYAHRISSAISFIDKENSNLEKKALFHKDDASKAAAEIQKIHLLQKIKNVLSE